MLERYLEGQQDKLQRLGTERRTQQAREDLERQRYNSLKYFVDSLAQAPADNALALRNRLAMRTQLDQLLGSQEQELQLASLESSASQRALRAQFGRVQGLKRVQEKQSAERAQQEKRAAQRQLDDWLNGGRRRD